MSKKSVARGARRAPKVWADDNAVIGLMFTAMRDGQVGLPTPPALSKWNALFGKYLDAAADKGPGLMAARRRLVDETNRVAAETIRDLTGKVAL